MYIICYFEDFLRVVVGYPSAVWVMKDSWRWKIHSMGWLQKRKFSAVCLSLLMWADPSTGTLFSFTHNLTLRNEWTTMTKKLGLEIPDFLKLRRGSYNDLKPSRCFTIFASLYFPCSTLQAVISAQHTPACRVLYCAWSIWATTARVLENTKCRDREKTISLLTH